MREGAEPLPQNFGEIGVESLNRMPLHGHVHEAILQLRDVYPEVA